ncbi:phage tail tape measure protein [Clostridium perfringens]|uniref:phage tail tape measure protein n=2 Tax=Clostridium perfringens TaxID=1502 RepID=UPI0018E42467|nr:phage tail tape measure protein [Clostridium perfringens]MBI6006311.1 phage tail tape measure protein [Clostridium perfringens]MDK0529028.1 phage tail tape measure protein [Clostridium perfringens]MDK0555171.1 phage tail tape measure protein [Clostridium perfringens]MDK0747178.1 phage tail tape measure protein [Clostridium perfringens]MDK0892464.1 phage tail tape measure protein [Clostridium perfringens]
MAVNVKIGANSSDFQKQMKEMTQELKKVSSSFNLANTQAKLFGKSTDLLKSRQSELTSKMQIQNRIIEAQNNNIKKLNGDLDKQKSTQKDLSSKIEETTRKYKESVEATGKNSKESKELAKELKGLKEDYAQNTKAIETNTTKLNNAETKLNNSKKALLENKKALEEVNKELEKSKLDKFTEGLGKAGEKAAKISNKMKPASVAITGLGTAMALSEMKFEDGTANINTLLDDQSHLDGYKDKVIEASNDTGKSLEDITDGMYTCISSIGDGGEETAKIFETMAKSAKAGGAETNDAVALISAGMKGYNQVNNETAKQISDLAFQTAKLGVTTFPEMASSMKPLFPLSSTLNISMQELFGSMATLTGVTGNTAEVSTQMKAVFSNLIKPTTDMDKLIKKYGYSNGQAMIKAKGLTGVLQILQKETGGQSDKLGKLFSSTEALTAVTALTGTQFDNFKDKTKAMNDALGSTDKALEKINNTTGNDLRTSLNMAKNSLVGFGEVLAPFISMGAKALSTLTKGLQDMSGWQKNLVVGFGASFVGANLLLGGFSKLSKGLKDNIKFAKDTAKAFKNGAGKLKDFAKATKEGTNIIGKFGKGILNSVKSVGKFAVSLVKSTVKGVIEFGKCILLVVKELGKLTLSLIKNTAILIKNGVVWTASKVKMLAYKTAQVAVTVATKAMTLAQKALNLALSMNPIGLVITLLVALAATFVYLYKHCENFRNGVNAVWSNVKSIFKGFANFFKGAFSRDWTQTFGLLCIQLNSFFGTVSVIWNGVKGVFTGIITFIKGVFTGNWRSAFQGLADIVKSIFGMLGGIIKAPINAAISGINMAIRGINGLSFDVPSWIPGIGGSHFGVNLPTIPALAEGGIVTKATMALVGEGKEHEAVIPLSKLDKLVSRSVEKVLNAKEDSKDNKQNNNIYEIIIPVDGKTIAKVVIDSMGNILNSNANSRAVVRGGGTNARFAF